MTHGLDVACSCDGPGSHVWPQLAGWISDTLTNLAAWLYMEARPDLADVGQVWPWQAAAKLGWQKLNLAMPLKKFSQLPQSCRLPGFGYSHRQKRGWKGVLFCFFLSNLGLLYDQQPRLKSVAKNSLCSWLRYFFVYILSHIILFLQLLQRL